MGCHVEKAETAETILDSGVVTFILHEYLSFGHSAACLTRSAPLQIYSDLKPELSGIQLTENPSEKFNH